MKGIVCGERGRLVGLSKAKKMEIGDEMKGRHVFSTPHTLRFTPHCICKGLLQIVVLVCVVFGVTLLLPAGEAPLRPVTLALQWIPQSQFAGFFVAKETGIYERYGLDVTFLSGGPGISAFGFLKEGKADFALLWLTSALQLYDQGYDLVNLFQVIQRSGLMLVAHADSGIEKPRDMEGKKVSLWGGDFAIAPQTFFEQYNIQVNEIQQSFTMNLFLRRAVDVASAMWYNEYYLLRNSGLDPEEITTFRFSEYELNFPEDGLYCLAPTIEQSPRLVQDFVRASQEGWHEAFRDYERTLDIVMRYTEEAHTGTNRVHQRWMLARMQDMMMPEDTSRPLGYLRREDFEFVCRQLREKQFIETQPSYDAFHLSFPEGEEVAQ